MEKETLNAKMDVGESETLLNALALKEEARISGAHAG